ncbi:hypothetical protein V6N13_058253 [Hibiscus sabdariffa]
MALIQETKKSSLVEEDIRKFWYDDELEFCFGEASGSSGRLVSIWDRNKFKVESVVINARALTWMRASKSRSFGDLEGDGLIHIV